MEKLKKAFQAGWGETYPCGIGSSEEGTTEIRNGLVRLCKHLRIESLNDYGCGKGDWITSLDLDVDYRGYDLVPHPEWVYGECFVEADIIKHKCRKADLGLIRDVFIHLPNTLILDALRNLVSTCKFLVISNYPGSTNQLRGSGFGTKAFARYDLMQPPFNFTRPEFLIIENQWDRELGVWRSNYGENKISSSIPVS